MHSQGYVYIYVYTYIYSQTCPCGHLRKTDTSKMRAVHHSPFDFVYFDACGHLETRTSLNYEMQTRPKRPRYRFALI